MSNQKKINSFIFLDLISRVAPIGLFFGRIANFINSELYGRETNILWSTKFISVDNLSRHPSQIYEAICEGLLLFLILSYLAKKKEFKFPGLISALFLIVYSTFRFVLEFYREPDLHIGYLTFGLTLGQYISLLFLFSGIILYCFKKNEKKSRKKITIDKYMNKAFYNKTSGYYMKKNPFGKNGDYITSPNISILFSEMIAIWIISFWEKLDSPKKFNLLELGAGNGEMIFEIIRTFNKFPLLKKSCNINILEKSKYLRIIQKKKLKKLNVKLILKII